MDAYSSSSDEADCVAWFESLPNWAWDAKSTEEYVAAASRRGKAQWENASEATRSEWCQKLSDAHSTPEAKAAQSKRATAMWANASEATRSEWRQKLSDAHSTPEAKAALAKRKREEAEARHAIEMVTMTEDEKSELQKKIHENRAAVERRHRALAELRKIPGWENSRIKNLVEARKLGLVPNNRIGPRKKRPGERS